MNKNLLSYTRLKELMTENARRQHNNGYKDYLVSDDLVQSVDTQWKARMAEEDELNRHRMLAYSRKLITYKNSKQPAVVQLYG